MIESLTGFLIFLHVRKYRVRNFFKKNVAIPVDMILWYSLFTRNTTSEWYSSGRVLGPLLFLIYVNDLIDHSGLYLDIYVFADDAKFFGILWSNKEFASLANSLLLFSVPFPMLLCHIFRLDALAKALSVIATATWLAGWLAGWLAVTLRYCIKTAKPIAKLFPPPESRIILVF